MRKLILLSSVGILAFGCSEQKSDDLTGQKAELKALKSEIAALQTKANKLQEAITEADPSAGANTKSVETLTIAPSNFSSYLTIEGKVDAENSTIATPKAPGVITSINARAGQFVRRGQTLARLDANAIAQSKAPLQQQLSLAKILYDKQKRLFDHGIGTEVQLLQAKTQVDATRKQLSAIDAQIAMYRVTSPISGTIESVDIKIGQAASPGIPAFKVVNLSSLKVIAEVAESYSSKIDKGDKVIVNIKDLGKEIPARVTFASKIIDPLNRTFKIEIRLPNIAGAKPNMLTTVKIADYENPSALAVPINAVQTTEEGSIVMVAVKSGKTITAKRVEVVVGISSGDKVEILSGLSAGDELIVVGNQDLNDGQRIDLPVNSKENQAVTKAKNNE